MKKFIYVLFCITFISLCACKKDAPGKADDKVTWNSLVKQYPFLGEFPEFAGEIENVVYSDSWGMEQVGFFDYGCKESVATEYYDKLRASGFADEGYGIFEKESADKTVEYTFIGGYAAGNFALSFNCVKD